MKDDMVIHVYANKSSLNNNNKAPCQCAYLIIYKMWWSVAYLVAVCVPCTQQGDSFIVSRTAKEWNKTCQELKHWRFSVALLGNQCHVHMYMSMQMGVESLFMYNVTLTD